MFYRLLGKGWALQPPKSACSLSISLFLVLDHRYLSILLSHLSLTSGNISEAEDGTRSGIFDKKESGVRNQELGIGGYSPILNS